MTRMIPPPELLGCCHGRLSPVTGVMCGAERKRIPMSLRNSPTFVIDSTSCGTTIVSFLAYRLRTIPSHPALRQSFRGLQFLLVLISGARSSISKPIRMAGRRRPRSRTTSASTTTSAPTRDWAIARRRQCTIQAAQTTTLSAAQEQATSGRQQDSTLILPLFCPKDGVHLIHAQRPFTSIISERTMEHVACGVAVLGVHGTCQCIRGLLSPRRHGSK